MKNIVIRKDFSFFYVNPEEMESLPFSQKIDSLNRELKSLYAKYGIEAVGDLTTLFDIENLSIMNCEKCGRLMLYGLNAARSESVSDIQQILCDGGEHDGKYICENCLQTSYR